MIWLKYCTIRGDWETSKFNKSKLMHYQSNEEEKKPIKLTNTRTCIYIMIKYPSMKNTVNVN